MVYLESNIFLFDDCAALSLTLLVTGRGMHASA